MMMIVDLCSALCKAPLLRYCYPQWVWSGSRDLWILWNEW